MRVIRGWSNRGWMPATRPFLWGNGVWIEFRGGDVADPMLDPDGWFGPVKPRFILRFFCSIPLLPWISWRHGEKGGYFGFKIYGVDSPAYTPWAGDDVFPGSQALCFSFRPFATIRE